MATSTGSGAAGGGAIGTRTVWLMSTVVDGTAQP
jgi:hypothetical protein